MDNQIGINNTEKKEIEIEFEPSLMLKLCGRSTTRGI